MCIEYIIIYLDYITGILAVFPDGLQKLLTVIKAFAAEIKTITDYFFHFPVSFQYLP